MSKDGIKHTTAADANVFADLGFDPVEAANLKLRAEAMAAIEQWISESGMTQAAIGEILGVSQSRVSDLKRGKIHLFSLDILIAFAARIGLNPATFLRFRQNVGWVKRSGPTGALRHGSGRQRMPSLTAPTAEACPPREQSPLGREYPNTGQPHGNLPSCLSETG